MEFLVHYDKAMRFLPRARTIYDVETTFGMVRVYYYASKGSEEKVNVIKLIKPNIRPDSGFHVNQSPVLYFY